MSRINSLVLPVCGWTFFALYIHAKKTLFLANDNRAAIGYARLRYTLIHCPPFPEMAFHTFGMSFREREIYRVAITSAYANHLSNLSHPRLIPGMVLRIPDPTFAVLDISNST